MLGRGVKRKWSCLEELEAETVPAAVTEEEEDVEQEEEKEEGGFLLGAGSRSAVSRLQQRQLVLGLCLEKLQAGVELSLRRSVLLINTLRQIHDDMRSDGPGNRTPDGAEPRCDGPLDGVDPDSRLLRRDTAVTCPGCAEGDREGPSLPPPPPPPHPSLSPVLPSHEANGQQKSQPAAPHNAFSDAVNAVGYLSDLALDDIFEDIDTSMYETSELPAAWAVSVSFWGDEEVKMRPSGHASAGTLQSCLMDLNELDHIMEILVKS
ncbi:cell division cycle-associated protein 4-like [Centroberyx affinis]|uniref:cell division cycle-associated protein 4-like n=1 Tax=Centroberyx affinis TaxID=166261 RepID=UPI003A5BEC01